MFPLLPIVFIHVYIKQSHSLSSSNISHGQPMFLGFKQFAFDDMDMFGEQLNPISKFGYESKERKFPFGVISPERVQFKFQNEANCLSHLYVYQSIHCPLITRFHQRILTNFKNKTLHLWDMRIVHHVVDGQKTEIDFPFTSSNQEIFIGDGLLWNQKYANFDYTSFHMIGSDAIVGFEQKDQNPINEDRFETVYEWGIVNGSHIKQMQISKGIVRRGKGEYTQFLQSFRYIYVRTANIQKEILTQKVTATHNLKEVELFDRNIENRLQSKIERLTFQNDALADKHGMVLKLSRTRNSS